MIAKYAPECGEERTHTSTVWLSCILCDLAHKITVVTYDSTSQGQLSMVIYEWRDMQYLGKVTSMVDDLLPVSVSASLYFESTSITQLNIAENVCLYNGRRSRGLLR